MNISLIITTYNWHEALELSLKSALNQTILPQEIIIADDGSGAATQKLIADYQQKSAVSIIHSWQKDEGFRAAMSRNKAIVASQNDYIISIDGDMILEKRFVEEHIKFAKKGFFTQGARVLLNESLSQQILETKNIAINCSDKGVKNRLNCTHSNLLASVFNKVKRSNTMKGIKTCNFAFFRDDVLAINGFNEDFIGWGREDSELVVRLFNNKIRRQNVKFNAIAYHIHHHENERKHLPQNDIILAEAIKTKNTFCPNGIDKYMK